MISTERLRVTENPEYDIGIEKVDFFEYLPTNLDLNSSGTITFEIDCQSIQTVPSEAYILIEGVLKKSDGTFYDAKDNIALVNNALMYLFNDVTYDLSGEQVERVMYPGPATTILGLMKYPYGFQFADGLKQMWYMDTSNLVGNSGFNVRRDHLFADTTSVGAFSFKIPLKHIFGFCETYDKVVYGFRHTITFTKKECDDAIYRAESVSAGMINLKKFRLYMPRVELDISKKTDFMNLIAQKIPIQVAYKSNKCERQLIPAGQTEFTWSLGRVTDKSIPRFILFGLQTNRNSSQTVNPSLFDHCDVSNFYVTVNGIKYPNYNYDLNFGEKRVVMAYSDAFSFDEKYYGTNDLVCQSGLTLLEYIKLYPLFFVDISKQKERVASETAELVVNLKFRTSTIANTVIFAVVISDKLLKFVSDGTNMTAVY